MGTVLRYKEEATVHAKCNPPLEKGGALSQINDMIRFLIDFSLQILKDFLHEEGHCRSLISQPEETTVAILLFISHYGSRDRLWHSGYDD